MTLFLGPVLSLLAALTLCSQLRMIYSNPHAPQQMAWEISNPMGQVVWKIHRTHTPGAWWPSLTPDLCQLFMGLDTWDIPDQENQNKMPICMPYPLDKEPYYGCSTAQVRCALSSLDFYVCPKDGRKRAQVLKCPESFYCKAWGCENTGYAYW